MKKLLPILAIVLCGCHTITMPTPNGNVTIESFGQRTKITELSYDPKIGTLKLKGYNNDQVDAIGIAVESAVKGAIQGAK